MRGGHVMLGQELPRWYQRAYPIGKLADILPNLAGEGDVYISQGRFWGYRREVAQLAWISALWADLDYYAPQGKVCEVGPYRRHRIPHSHNGAWDMDSG